MPEAQPNIFLTMENLAFAMPLILLCTVYAYFTYVPLTIGIPLLGLVGAGVYLRMHMQKRKDDKLQNLDEDAIRDIVGDEDEVGGDSKSSKNNNKSKAKNKNQQRLEKRVADKKKTKDDDDEGDNEGGDDDEAMMTTFAKGSRQKQKKT